MKHLLAKAVVFVFHASFALLTVAVVGLIIAAIAMLCIKGVWWAIPIVLIPGALFLSGAAMWWATEVLDEGDTK